MAYFFYKCDECGKFRVSLDKREKTFKCPKCGRDSLPLLLGGATSRITEVIDNGLMARSVERLHNIEEIMEQRSKINSRGNDED